ncbi:MAG: DNA-3-methyladenine glycosylase 2 family protein [Actinomycetota bacterium]
MARGPLRRSTTAVAADLGLYRYGAADPTTRLNEHEFWRATLTPDGPGTLHLDWHDGVIRADSWGPGAQWLLDGVPALTGALDPGHSFTHAHARILRAQHFHDVRFGASRTLYHELLPTVLGQRITAGEAFTQWHRLVRAVGAPAPGPSIGLLLPPSPDELLRRPTWWFHPLGIEARRADALRTVARHADRIGEWAGGDAAHAAEHLGLLPGIGPWTIGSVLGHAMADTDAIAIGDFHLKHLVAHALTGRPRGTDDEMRQTLEPYRGQRGRVVRLLHLSGLRAPAFGPRQRVLDMTGW